MVDQPRQSHISLSLEFESIEAVGMRTQMVKRKTLPIDYTMRDQRRHKLIGRNLPAQGGEFISTLTT